MIADVTDQQKVWEAYKDMGVQPWAVMQAVLTQGGVKMTIKCPLCTYPEGECSGACMAQEVERQVAARCGRCKVTKDEAKKAGAA